MPANIPRCQHFKTNGVFCGSPALRGHRFCYFHHHWRSTHPNAKPADRQPAFELPLLEDANAVQVALQRVMHAILNDLIDTRKAGLLLYALQTAASNLKNTMFEHYKLQEQAQASYSQPAADDDQDDACEICAPPEPEEEEAEVEEGAGEVEKDEDEDDTEQKQEAKFIPGSSASSALKGFPNALKLPPRTEHDEELTDDDLIKAIRQLAGLT